MKRSNVKELLASTETNKDVLLKGWVRTRRGNSQVAFIAINDGTIIHNIQVVADLDKVPAETMKRVTTGSSISVTGKLVESLGKGQSVEIQAEEIQILGDSDPEVYPLQKKGHSFEFLRENAHLRFRTNTFGAVFRIRHALA
ncbi:MAG: OB-fold nucleic acid binding domain-containing protein, partial [Bacteroides sp.]|nr:OB-fold nucleic acid binding domain-containing protein [Bacteroides sp.]